MVQSSQTIPDDPAPSLPLSVPVPDPTVLTTQNLRREILGLRELIEEKLSKISEANLATRAVIETRLDGMDRAIKLLQDTSDKFPARIDEKIQALREVHNERFEASDKQTTEKFTSIQTQFLERDVRTEQAAGAVKIAVDAALQAQKEAVGEQNKSSSTAISKSETATTKQIDQLVVLIQTMSKQFDDKVNDLKDRLNRTDGSSSGKAAMWGYLVAAVGFLLTLVTLGGVFFNSQRITAGGGAAPAPAPALAPQVIYVPAPAGTQLPVVPPTAAPR